MTEAERYAEWMGEGRFDAPPLKTWTMFVLLTTGRWVEYEIEAPDIDDASEQANRIAQQLYSKIRRTWFVEPKREAA